MLEIMVCLCETIYKNTINNIIICIVYVDLQDYSKKF